MNNKNFIILLAVKTYRIKYNCLLKFKKITAVLSISVASKLKPSVKNVVFSYAKLASSFKT